MRSRTMLGLIALFAIIVAAICFAVVDISTSAAGSCLRSASPCAIGEDSARATLFAIVGAVALLVAIAPAIAWLVHAPSRLNPVHADTLQADVPDAAAGGELPVESLTGD